MCRKDQPSEKLGFGFICYIIYSDDLCFSKGTSLYTLIALYKRHQLPFQKQMGRLHSQSSATSVYPGTPAVPALLSELCSLEDAGDTPGDDC